MKRKDKAREDKIIFVNSFKGGAGKTTLSLTYCIDALFHETTNGQKYDNVIYMDLDILGTGVSYLFDEKRLSREKCFNKSKQAVEIPLAVEDKEKMLYVAYLDPVQQKTAVYGTDSFSNHQEIACEVLKKDVKDFIKQQVESDSTMLLVLDCAPGFSEFEQKILAFCYNLALSFDVDVEEIYVSTLDAAHIKKSIQCLNEEQKSYEIKAKYRKIKVVLNDLQNYMTSTGVDDEEATWMKVYSKMATQLSNKEVEIYAWKYSFEIATKCVYSSEQKVENQVDSYLFTKDNYKKLM